MKTKILADFRICISVPLNVTLEIIVQKFARLNKYPECKKYCKALQRSLNWIPERSKDSKTLPLQTLNYYPKSIKTNS